uniref:Uncharacterized protein n=1 Tax=Oryzias latipes TaxID=8090 RepID=A0A3P9KME4_ORYLA
MFGSKPRQIRKKESRCSTKHETEENVLCPTPPATRLCPTPPATRLCPTPPATRLCPTPPATRLCPTPPATRLCPTPLCPTPPATRLCPTPPATRLCPTPPATRLCPTPPATRLCPTPPATRLCPTPPATRLCPTPPATRLCPTPPATRLCPSAFFNKSDSYSFRILLNWATLPLDQCFSISGVMRCQGGRAVVAVLGTGNTGNCSGRKRGTVGLSAWKKNLRHCYYLLYPRVCNSLKL